MKFNGLTDREVEESRKKHGSNAIPDSEPTTFWQEFKETFGDPMIKILLAIAALMIVMFFFGYAEIYEPLGTIVAVLIVAFVSAKTGVASDTKYRELKDSTKKDQCKVHRNGVVVVIDVDDVVVGDKVLLQAGDKIPADGILISGNLHVDNSALNGEAEECKKTEAPQDFQLADDITGETFVDQHSLFRGAVVFDGEGILDVRKVGLQTMMGKMAEEMQEEEPDSPLKVKLAKLAKQISTFGYIGAIVIAVLYFAYFIVSAGGPSLYFAAGAEQIIKDVVEAVSLAVVIIVCAVPEGLPLMISLVLMQNTSKMLDHNVLVRKAEGIETAGSLNILFSDKTGTITQGNLSLVEFITGDGKIAEHIPSQEFIEAITLNNLAKVSEGKPIGSNNMDRALLGYALEHGYDDSKNDPDKVADISGFDSEKKCATVTLKNGLVYWKGATENIIDKVTHYMLPSGEEKEFTAADKKAVEDQMLAQAKRTMKLLSVAKIADGKTVLMAVLCLRDNVRTDAVETVEILNNAGIQVVMVTGDAEETAVAIAKEAGILKDEQNDVVLTHEELEQMSDEELKKKLPNLRVVSRAKPLDKKRLVSISQQLDNVCGMTGDGVNDAPALKQADIGFAMGDGTAVAQEAGDVVILNNSLTSIKDCVLNSRTMSKSVGKFLIFQLTVNISTLLMNIIAPILGWTEPFSIVQILWINLIMDTLAAMAFGGEPILDRYMNEKPALRKDNILTTYIKSAIGTSSVFITLGSILILENIGGITDFVTPAGCADPELYEKTFMFAFFIYSIIFNSLNTRSERFNVFEHIEENKNFIIVMGVIFILQTIIIEIGGQVFSTTTLNAKALFVSMLLAVLIIPVDMVRKAIVSKK